jgi:hypothetical protein
MQDSGVVDGNIETMKLRRMNPGSTEAIGSFIDIRNRMPGTRMNPEMKVPAERLVLPGLSVSSIAVHHNEPRLMYYYIKALARLRRLVTSFSPPRPGFSVRSVHVGFVIEKVALGQVFFEDSGFPCKFPFHQKFHFFYYPGLVQWGRLRPKYKGTPSHPKKIKDTG